MARSDTRPINLNLLKIRFPINAIASILHRISGVILAIAIPFLMLMLDWSLSGEAGFVRVQHWMGALWPRLLVALLFWAMSHHLLAGIRYLLLDAEVGISRQASRGSAWLVIVSGMFLAVALAMGVLL